MGIYKVKAFDFGRILTVTDYREYWQRSSKPSLFLTTKKALTVEYSAKKWYEVCTNELQHLTTVSADNLHVCTCIWTFGFIM